MQGASARREPDLGDEHRQPVVIDLRDLIPLTSSQPLTNLAAATIASGREVS